MNFCFWTALITINALSIYQMHLFYRDLKDFNNDLKDLNNDINKYVKNTNK